MLAANVNKIYSWYTIKIMEVPYKLLFACYTLHGSIAQYEILCPYYNIREFMHVMPYTCIMYSKHKDINIKSWNQFANIIRYVQ